MQTPKVIKKPYIKLRKLFRPKTKPAGLPPGTAIYTGDVPKGEKVFINLIDYKGNLVNEKEIIDPELGVYTQKDNKLD
jgi:hypothetical protein